LAKFDTASPDTLALQLSEAQHKWLARTKKHVGKQAWLATMPWCNPSKSDTSSPQTSAVPLSEAQQKWFAQAEKRIGKQAWLATLPLCNKTESQAASPQAIASVVDKNGVHAATTFEAKFDTSSPQTVATPLTESQGRWLAKAEKRVGKQAWLATLPWYRAMNLHVSLPQTTASPVAEKELHADTKSYTEAQRKWLAKAEKHAGKQAWLATMPWYRAIVDSAKPVRAEEHLQLLFPAQIMQCVQAKEQASAIRPDRFGTFQMTA
jgi:hypothetical protein